MDTQLVGRREFLITAALAGGGLALHGLWRPCAAQGSAETAVALNAWIKIGPDNRITIVASQAEMGQGIQTTMAAVLAEELGADWKMVAVEEAPADPAYRNPRLNWQFTGNSESTAAFFDLMREMGAKARAMLEAAAAATWKVSPATCRAHEGYVHHIASGVRASFGELAASAATQAAPAKPPLKTPSEWTLVGKALPRLDSRAKVTGAAQYGIDVVRPGMLSAAIRMCPSFTGTVAHVDRAALAQLPGVVDVVPLQNAVAVVAHTYWQARTALDALNVTFEGGTTADSAALDRQYRSALDGDAWHPVRSVGDPARGFRTVVSEIYESQFLAHATMEPMNCTAEVTADRCEVWAPTQGQQLAQLMLSQTLGLPKERIVVNRTLLGGGFGRRLYPDFIVQAALIAKAVRRPVKLLWPREEDMQHDIYRPAVLHRLTAGLDDAGRLQALDHRLVSPSILQFVYPPAVSDVFDPSCCEGLIETRYRIPRSRVDFHLLKIGVPTSVLRTTGYGPNIFALESFIDELAHHRRQDPYAFRRALLASDRRALQVLDRAAAESHWHTPAPKGRYRGIAFADAFRTLTAHVVELSVPEPGTIKIHRVVCVADPGTVLDPGISANSIEGGVAWGLSCAFTSQVTFDGGRAVQSNFHDYEIVRMPQMPPVDIHWINSGARPLGGIGEVGPVTLVPALTNAIFAATGTRHRSLPLSKHGLRLA